MTPIERAARQVIEDWKNGDSGQVADSIRHLESVMPAELPAAVFIGDWMKCQSPGCGALNRDCQIIEHGYSVTHQFISVSDTTIKAHAWDGSSDNVSEEGKYVTAEGPYYTLDCVTCFTEHAVPEGFSIEFDNLDNLTE